MTWFETKLSSDRSVGNRSAGHLAAHALRALLVASERAVQRYELEPIARIVAGATAGVEPRIMGVGPVSATRRLLDKTGLSLDQFDVIELNEAFAAQALACLRMLGIADAPST